jgi:hypothetical protein
MEQNVNDNRSVTGIKVYDIQEHDDGTVTLRAGFTQ